MDAAQVAENRAAQSDEAEVLKSIYGEDCVFRSENSSCEILVRPSEQEGILLPLRLRLYFPESYPIASEPIFEMDAPWFQHETSQMLVRALHKIYEDHAGTVIVFTWVEWIKEQAWIWEEAKKWALSHSNCHFNELDPEAMDSTIDSDFLGEICRNGAAKTARKEQKLKNLLVEKDEDKDTPDLGVKELEELDKILGIIHGIPLTEKRSTFQAHLACASSVDQVETVMEALLSNRKVAGATHNIMAYRISIPEKGTVLQDYDDDGETAAGGRLLHLLQIVDAMNVVVVVSRWFGGILLGPDRFKHINNAARSLLSACGYIKGDGQPGSSVHKLKSQSKAGHKGKRH